MADVEGLYRSHHGWLLNALRRRLGCGESAADVAHDTFVRLMGKTDEQKINNPRAFLATLAKGIAVDLSRRRAIERAYLDVLEQMPLAVLPSEEDRLLLIETISRIEDVLQGLPERQRRAFLLSRLDGISYREIAKAHGVSLSTVEKDIAMVLRRCYHARYGS